MHRVCYAPVPVFGHCGGSMLPVWFSVWNISLKSEIADTQLQIIQAVPLNITAHFLVLLYSIFLKIHCLLPGVSQYQNSLHLGQRGSAWPLKYFLTQGKCIPIPQDSHTWLWNQECWFIKPFLQFKRKLLYAMLCSKEWFPQYGWWTHSRVKAGKWWKEVFFCKLGKASRTSAMTM